MKLRFTIVLLLLSSCLLSCNSEPSVTASPTAPSSQDTPISTTYPSAPVTIPVEWPEYTSQLPGPITSPEDMYAGLPDTSHLPVTTHTPLWVEPPDGEGWGKSPFFFHFVKWCDEGVNGIVLEDGESLELYARIGHEIDVGGNIYCTSDPTKPMELLCKVNGEAVSGALGGQYVIEDFWTNTDYMIHPHENNPYRASPEIKIIFDTTVLTTDQGEILIHYSNNVYAVFGDIKLCYEKRDGMLILTTSPLDNAIDMVYDTYLNSNPQ